MIRKLPIILSLIAIGCSSQPQEKASSPEVEGRIIVKTDNGPHIGLDNKGLERLKAYRTEGVSEQTFNLGRPATPEEIAAWDIDIPPDGHGLPNGSGTVPEGAEIYKMKCASCHSTDGKGQLPFGALVADGSNGKTVGSYWPHATTIFDYVRRSMPFDTPGSLSNNEVYAITAFLLHQNGIILEEDVMDASSLPLVKMPNADLFQPDDRENFNAVH